MVFRFRFRLGPDGTLEESEFAVPFREMSDESRDSEAEYIEDRWNGGNCQVSGNGHSAQKTDTGEPLKIEVAHSWNPR